MARRMRRLFVGVSIVVSMVGCSSGSRPETAHPSGSRPLASLSVPPFHGVTAFHDDFRSGAFDARWVAEHAVVQRHGGADPAAWVRLTAASVPAYLSLRSQVFGTGHTQYMFQGRFRVISRAPHQSVGLATIENSAGKNHDDFFIDAATGRCRVDIYRGDTALTTTRCDDARWHRVTMIGDYGSSTYALRCSVDGVSLATVRSVGQMPAAVQRLWLGDATPAKTNLSDWADVSITIG